MTPTVVDHLIVFGLLVVVPIRGSRNFRRFRDAVAIGGSAARRREYRREIRKQWGFAGALLALWLLLDRSPTSLGLTLPLDLRTLWGALVTGLALGLLWSQWRKVARMGPEALARQSDQLEGLRALLPHSEEDARVFRVLSLTAGVCEEVLYRGYLIAYLSAYVADWPAAIVAGIAFGIAHAYQGMSGIVKTGLTGMVAALLYVGTGSLLWPILLHAGIDLHAGAVGRRIVEAV